MYNNRQLVDDERVKIYLPQTAGSKTVDPELT